MSSCELIPGKPPLCPTTFPPSWMTNPKPYSGDASSGFGAVSVRNPAALTSFPCFSASANRVRSPSVE